VTDVRITHIGGPTPLIADDAGDSLTDPTFDPRAGSTDFGWRTAGS
jgi:hypothetical protein